MLKTFKHPKYTYTKNGIYYFSIAVPSDLESHYSKKSIIQSLRTKSKEKAKQSAQLLAGRLIDYWFHLRLKNTEPPLAELITNKAVEDDCITINKVLFEKIEQATLKRYPKLVLFDGFGKHAQSLEGQILLDVMTEGVKRDITVLPIHDAVAVSTKDREWALSIMEEKWVEYRVSSSSKIKPRLK
jgi:ATP-dependent protease HslVU (ClpYQ) ATPase subunit